MTDGQHIYNVTRASDFSGCCDRCVTDHNCTAWVFVADGHVYSEGPGTCKLRHTVAQCRPNKTDHISGSLYQSATPAAGRQPHIVLLVVDDWGWGDVGYHRRNVSGPDDILTPNFDSLVRSGFELDRNYVHKFCSPTRSSIQTGRLPVHVNLVNADPTVSNPGDPVSGWAGIPRNMTGIAAVLKRAGYRTHLVGKWDCGMASPDHTPRGRGYDSSFGYFHHANDYWVEAIGKCPDRNGPDPADPDSKVDVIDLWMADDGGSEHGASGGGGQCVFCNGTAPPGAGSRYVPMHNSASLLGVNGTVRDYEEWKFLQYALAVIRNHTADRPLFLNYNMHVVHEPLQTPYEYFAAQEVLTNRTYPDAPNQPRAVYHAMVAFADDCLGNLTAALRAKGMWNDTLVVVTSDNGGPMYGNNAANNWPLKGHKFTSWEGGIRVIGSVGGGFMDTARGGGCVGCRREVGSRLDGIVHGADWYATFAALAGVVPEDSRASMARLPPPDSINLWPYLSGAVSDSPRTSFHIDANALVTRPYKLLLGKQKGACYSGPHVPNATGATECTTVTDCGEVGCLFDVFDDPLEQKDLAKVAVHAGTLEKMRAQLLEENDHLFSPDRGTEDPRACERVRANGGYWGPFAE